MLNLRNAGSAATGILAGVMAVTAAQGAVETGSDVPQLAVHYRASQLDTEQGVRHLYRRLLSAAAQVCPQPTGPLPNGAITACREQAVADAVAQIHSARLAALTNRWLKSG